MRNVLEIEESSRPRVLIAGSVSSQGEPRTGLDKDVFESRRTDKGQYIVTFNELDFAPVVLATPTVRNV